MSNNLNKIKVIKDKVANENPLIESGLDSCYAAISIESNKVLNEQLMFIRARSLIEYAQLFISQCSQPADPTINSKPGENQQTICEKFEEYLKSLKGKQRVSWKNFNKMLNQDVLAKDTLVGKLVTLIFGEEYLTQSFGIHSLDRYDLLWFRAELEKTQNISFQTFKPEWKSLIDFIAEPEHFEACVNQKKRLIQMKKLLF